MKGKILITHFHGSTSGINITVVDEISGCECADITLTAEAFGETATGHSYQECDFELRPLNVGKTREVKSEVIPFKYKNLKKEEEEAKAVLKPYEIDGWEGSWRDLCNHHRRVGNDSYRVGFTRFV